MCNKKIKGTGHELEEEEGWCKHNYRRAIVFHASTKEGLKLFGAYHKGGPLFFMQSCWGHTCRLDFRHSSSHVWRTLPEKNLWGRSVGSFPEQQLVIEPSGVKESI